jgi:autotransporter-associated beta strand protein
LTLKGNSGLTGGINVNGGTLIVDAPAPTPR